MPAVTAQLTPEPIVQYFLPSNIPRTSFEIRPWPHSTPTEQPLPSHADFSVGPVIKLQSLAWAAKEYCERMVVKPRPSP
jgi:hypothetical protein